MEFKVEAASNLRRKFLTAIMPHIFDHNGSAHGSLMLHGHRHGNPTNIPGRIMDVGFDATGFVVSNLSEVVRTLTKITPMPHH